MIQLWVLASYVLCCLDFKIIIQLHPKIKENPFLYFMEFYA